jgi:hypothetical protein
MLMELSAFDNEKALALKHSNIAIPPILSLSPTSRGKSTQSAQPNNDVANAVASRRRQASLNGKLRHYSPIRGLTAFIGMRVAQQPVASHCNISNPADSNADNFANGSATMAEAANPTAKSSTSIPMVIPKQGPVYSQLNMKAPVRPLTWRLRASRDSLMLCLPQVMCKPKIMPLKSAALLKQENMAKDVSACACRLEIMRRLTTSLLSI